MPGPPIQLSTNPYTHTHAGGIAITTLNFGPLITGLYCFGLFLGTIYSVPPLRLKRSAIAAFLIIATGEPLRSQAFCRATAAPSAAAPAALPGVLTAWQIGNWGVMWLDLS